MMKHKIVLMLALLCAIAQGTWAQTSWEEVYQKTGTTSDKWTAINAGSTTGQTLGSAGSTTYCYAGGDLRFTNSNAGGSGLTIQGTVYLYVPQGVTLTCIGANANGQTGAGAGIELAAGNTLYLFGGGTVNAMGGNAANGGNGGNGNDAFLDSDKTILGGSGGNGGHGGGGAGAGIGTRGGTGGSGGGGGQRTGSSGDEKTQHGVDGSAGSTGGTADNMGSFYEILSSVTLVATGGSAGSNGTGGDRGLTASQHPGSDVYMASGGGGGGAGGFGGAASNIGTGGPGGGGGGGGAAGNVAWVVYSGTANGYYHAGAKGGKGGINGDSTSAPEGTSIELTNPKYADIQGGGLRPSASDYTDDAGWEKGNAWHDGGSGGAAGNESVALLPIHGAGSQGDPYIIDDASQLAQIASKVNSGETDYLGKHFSLTRDLDLSGQNWMPIGTNNHPFKGNFNGNNHIISNLTVNNPSGDFNGLFGYVEGLIRDLDDDYPGSDYIRNFVVKNANVTGHDYTGGVAGRVHGQLWFENVILDGATVQGANFTSGFIGSAEGDYEQSGVISNYSELHLKNCLFLNGSVTENTGHEEYDWVLQGRASYAMFGNIQRYALFSNCYFNNIIYNGATAQEDYYNIQGYPVTFDVPSGVNCDINTSSAAFYDNAYYYANKGTVNFNLSYKDLGRKVTSVKINGVEAGTALGQYSFTIDVSQTQSYAVTIESATTGSTGSGDSAADPILITSTEVWDLFAENVNKGINYSGKYLKLGADISVSTMVGTSVNKFSGTFDGNRDHYTLTFTKGSPESPFNEEYCAPFRFANNATFKNLKVAGDIYTSQKYATGIVGWCNGTINITNCRVGIVIHSSKEGDGTHGGLVAMPQSIQMYGFTTTSAVNIADCVFDGRFFTTNGTTSCAGFVGWHNSQRVVITNSIFAPNPAIAAGEGETSINDGATFIRGGGAGTGCYYTVAMGDAQGTQAYAAAPDGIISKQQTLVDGNSYYLPCTVTTPRKYYRYTGEEISVIIPAVSAPYGATLTEGTDYTYAINPNPVMEKGEYTVTLTGQGTCTGVWSFTFTVLDLLPVTSETTVLEENLTYKVNEDVTIASRITVKGKVILILGEGTTLTAPKGIELSSSNNADLTIEGPGALTIDNSDYWKAGIGAYSVGTLTINGGVINVKGGRRAAGIGGDSNNSNGGVITINGGVVNATGGEVAAGIGGGSDGENGNYGVCGAITINGGQVTATGNQAPGIGPGFEYSEETGNHYYNSGTLTLGWSSPSDFVYNNGLKNNGGSTLESITFAEGKKFVIEGTAIMATASNIGGKKIVPFNMPTFSGAGTEEEPYLIRNADEWFALCVDVSGGNSYSGKFLKLTDDISVTHKMGIVSGGTQQNAFSGTFDGDEHTITATISDNDNPGTALFCYINGATIKNLTVAGTISSNQSHTSGLVGFAAGTNRIEGCTVIATLNIGKDYAGGIIGHGLTSSTTISSCVFAGTVVGNGGSRSNIGGIWGWSDSAAPVLVNCLEKGTYTSITSMHPMGLLAGSGTVTDCYYVTPQIGSPRNASSKGGATRLYNISANEIREKAVTINGISAYHQNVCTVTGIDASYDLSSGNISITPIVTAPNGSRELHLSDDYTAALNGTAVTSLPIVIDTKGEKTLVITGMGSYGGSMSITFQVTGSYKIDVTLRDGDTYTKTEDTETLSATYLKTLGEERVGKYQAWFLPFDYTITAADTQKFTFYKINMVANSPDASQEATDAIWMFVKPMQAGDVLHANMPYVYKPKEAVTDYAFTTTNVVLKAKNTGMLATMQTMEDTYTLYGTYEPTTATAQDPFYYMNINGELSLGNNGTVSVGAFRWIMRVEGKSGAAYAKRIIIFDGETTGIETLAPTGRVGEGPWYTIDGRKLDGKPSRAGVYIYKGVKVAIK